MRWLCLGVEKEEKLHIAIFGDVHGHLRLMLRLCREWQLAHRTRLDAVLICGDLGFFPDRAALDRATIRFAEKDAEEVGFALYFAQPQPLMKDPAVDEILCGPTDSLGTVSCPMIFCHGNHEDFHRLRTYAESGPLTPVDYYGRVHYLRSGCCVDIADLRVGALGGEPEWTGCAPAQLVDKWVSPDGAKALMAVGDFHVLLSHSPPRFYPRQGHIGSELVQTVIDTCQPAYHFFGHVRYVCQPQTFGRCQSFWLQNVTFRPGKGGKHLLDKQCMGILTWQSPTKHSFQYVDEPWFEAIHHRNWWPPSPIQLSEPQQHLN
ncbi:MAG: metallophosphoesterase [Thermoguttaceae bacterium]|nr:metallophosphoesterase [Thermoguttaceae bacterium]